MFYVQLHLHTAESSRCGYSGGAEMARACKKAGYDLIVITDHFFNSNINCEFYLPWKHKIKALFAGYHAAKREGERIGLSVLGGWETRTDNGPEYLTYGLGEEFLIKNPDIARCGKREYLERVKDAGGYVIQAHPFRKAYYIDEFMPDPTCVEAFEVVNTMNSSPEFDAQALAMARKHGLIETAGSDAHHASMVAYGAMRFENSVNTADEIFAALRAGEAQILREMPYVTEIHARLRRECI